MTIQIKGQEDGARRNGHKKGEPVLGIGRLRLVDTIDVTVLTPHDARRVQLPEGRNRYTKYMVEPTTGGQWYRFQVYEGPENPLFRQRYWGQNGNGHIPGRYYRLKDSLTEIPVPPHH